MIDATVLRFFQILLRALRKKCRLRCKIYIDGRILNDDLISAKRIW
jgi:hypothetical protein